MSFSLFKKAKYIKELTIYYKNWPLILCNRILNRVTKFIVLYNNLTITGNSKCQILDLVDEIFIKKIYNPQFLQINPLDTVVDIGANIGVFSLYASLSGASSIYSIEPLKANTDLILKNFRNNKFKMPIIIQSAVSDINGKTLFYIGDFDSHGQISKIHYDVYKNKSILVNTITLKYLLKHYNINRVDYLKVDCEGSEGQIISSLSKSDWEKIHKISLEYHDGISTLSHISIINILRNNMFKVRLKKIDSRLGYIYAWK